MPRELFERLAALGVVLSIDADGRLAFDAPAGVLGDDLLAEMRSQRDELIDLVELRGERAAVREHEGGLSRCEAELLAMDDLASDLGPRHFEPIHGVICPWCRRGDELVDVDAGLSCDRCGRLAWRFEADDSMVRLDCGDLIEVDGSGW